MLLLLACVDYAVKGEETDAPFTDSAADTDTTPPDDTATDTDTTDTDTTDTDTDTDTPVDVDACTPASAAAGTVAIDAACEGLPPDIVDDPYDMELIYEYETTGVGPTVKTTVANLNDDDGDGLVTTADIPDFAFTVWEDDELIVLSGDGSGELFRLPDWNGMGDIVTGDVNADGTIDICGFTTRPYYLQCVDRTGAPVWTSSAYPSTSMPHITMCDIDADGLPEVIGDTVVVNGEDGSYAFGLAGAFVASAPVCADIDLDGYPEILYADRVYDKNGAQIRDFAGVGTSMWPVPINADADDEAEVFVASDLRLSLWESDGTNVFDIVTASEYPAPPCAADFDDDGEVEIAVVSWELLTMYDTDGTVLWDTVVNEHGWAGCSSFDMDGDTVPEVLLADEVTFHVFDGRTGATLFETTDHNSGTMFEFPVVADIDKDGHAEILITENHGRRTGLRVYAHDGDGWPAAGEVWHSHDYVETNIEEDGTVPTVPEPSWLNHNLFRGRPTVTGDMGDLEGAIVDVCVADCVNGPVTASVQVWNSGAASVRATLWSLYRDDGGVLTWVTSGGVPRIPAGERLASFEVSIALDDVGTDGFVITLDDDGVEGRVDECSEADNTIRYSEPVCP